MIIKAPFCLSKANVSIRLFFIVNSLFTNSKTHDWKKYLLQRPSSMSFQVWRDSLLFLLACQLGLSIISFVVDYFLFILTIQKLLRLFYKQHHQTP